MANDKFELRGVNHLALVCKDMARTVEFYRDVLGMPLIKTINLPADSGQHFSSTPATVMRSRSSGSRIRRRVCRGDASGPSVGPGIAHDRTCFDEPRRVRRAAGEARGVSAEACRRGIDVTPVIHHDDSPMQASMQPTESTFVKSIYFKDPDGIMLEFAGWTRELDERDVNVEPHSP